MINNHRFTDEKKVLTESLITKKKKANLTYYPLTEVILATVLSVTNNGNFMVWDVIKDRQET